MPGGSVPPRSPSGSISSSKASPPPAPPPGAVPPGATTHFPLGSSPTAAEAEDNFSETQLQLAEAALRSTKELLAKARQDTAQVRKRNNDYKVECIANRDQIAYMQAELGVRQEDIVMQGEDIPEELLELENKSAELNAKAMKLREELAKSDSDKLELLQEIEELRCADRNLLTVRLRRDDRLLSWETNKHGPIDLRIRKLEIQREEAEGVLADVNELVKHTRPEELRAQEAEIIELGGLVPGSYDELVFKFDDLREPNVLAPEYCYCPKPPPPKPQGKGPPPPPEPEGVVCHGVQPVSVLLPMMYEYAVRWPRSKPVLKYLEDRSETAEITAEEWMETVGTLHSMPLTEDAPDRRCP